MYLLLIDKKAPARVVKLFLRSCRIGLKEAKFPQKFPNFANFA